MIEPVQDRNPSYVTLENAESYRQVLGIASDDQLHRVVRLRNQLAEIRTSILELFIDSEGDFGETLDGIEQGIATMDTIIAPTGDAITELLFIDSDDEEECRRISEARASIRDIRSSLRPPELEELATGAHELIARAGRADGVVHADQMERGDWDASAFPRQAGRTLKLVGDDHVGYDPASVAS